MSTPAIEGRSRNILERIYVWVDEVLDSYYSTYYVTTNYKEDIAIQRTFPAISIRIDPVIITDEVFGRSMPEVGSTADYEFSIHAYEKFNTGTDEDYNEDVQLLATRIMNWLSSKDQNQTENTNYGIRNVIDVASRESDPNLRNVARMIIEGRIVTNRIDSP